VWGYHDQKCAVFFEDSLLAVAGNPVSIVHRDRLLVDELEVPEGAEGDRTGKSGSTAGVLAGDQF
jgi:hypothetical protein